MNATLFGPALSLFASIAIIAVLVPIDRPVSFDRSIASPRASAPPAGAVVLAQGRCFNGRCKR